MRLLLDTHVWLWMIGNPTQLHPDIRALFTDKANTLFLSTASTWDFIEPRLARDDVRALPIDNRHAVEVAGLPDHHNDPFDRLLVGQARVESLTLVTADRKLEPYQVDLLWSDQPRRG